MADTVFDQQVDILPFLRGFSPDTAFQVSERTIKLPDTHSAIEALLTDPPFDIAVASTTLRSKIDALPLIDCSSLQSLDQKRRAFKILAFAATGYVWGNGDFPVLATLPRQLAIPLQELGEFFRIVPLACYATTVLWNCRLVDETLGWIPQNVEVETTFTGTWDEKWFYGVSACVEAAGAKVIENLVSVASIIKSDGGTEVSKVAKIENHFAAAQKSLQSMVGLLHRVFEMDSETFYWKMRPYFAGWALVQPSDYNPRGGVHYAGVDGENETRHYVGISAAQSTLFQCLDVLLGVNHKQAQATMLRNTRAHMPGDHRDFLEGIEALYTGTIPAFVAGSPSSMSRYNECVAELARFRSIHLAAATKFAVREANRPGKSSFGLAKSSSDGGGAIGAGGSTLQPFLRDLIKRTKAAKLLPIPASLKPPPTVIPQASADKPSSNARLSVKLQGGRWQVKSLFIPSKLVNRVAPWIAGLVSL